MNAARFAEQIGNVANLKLRPTALYLLGSSMDDGPGALFSPENDQGNRQGRRDPMGQRRPCP